MKTILLTRDVFRESVFQRDNHACVICKEPAKDAHHIIERRLFTDGGYYIDNGASLCELHHIAAEQTTLSCEDIRKACGITRIILPEHLYDDYQYDKWGNILLANSQRIKGDLFFDESVQKILKLGGVLDLFQKYIKHPRLYHLHWSNMLKDDRIMLNDDCFKGERVIASIKMDGEQTTWYNDYIHARSLDSASHESRNYVKGLWAKIAYNLDDNMRICGENLYAKHTIRYSELPSYFTAFSMWMDNVCLDYDETMEYFKILGIDTPYVFYDGIYDREAITKAFSFDDKLMLTSHKCEWNNEKSKRTFHTNEGYVIRLARKFTYNDFRKSVGKFVRPEFKDAVNNSHGHWVSKKLEVNAIL